MKATQCFDIPTYEHTSLPLLITFYSVYPWANIALN